jgi:hypothetical protein
MVFLASHVICSRMGSLRYLILRLLNDPSIESQQAIKIKAQSLEPFLEKLKENDYVTEILTQGKTNDSKDFKQSLVQIVGPGSSSSQINILLHFVRTPSPLSIVACEQLPHIFDSASESIQLQITKLLISEIEDGTPGLAKVASTVIDSIHLPTRIILSLLEDAKIEVDSRDNSPARKRQRIDSNRSSPGIMSEGLSSSIRRLTLLLEVLERQNLEEHVDIISPLFTILDRLVSITDTRSSMNYAKQMVLSCLISLVKGLQVSDLSIILIVACYRCL